jgi:capsular polysaccharide biosynthesis protein
MDTKPRQHTREKLVGRQHVLSFGDLYRIARKQLWVILLSMLVLAGATVGPTFLQTLHTPRYESSLKILVSRDLESVEQGYLLDDIKGLRQFFRTIIATANTRPVAEAVIQKLDLQATPETLMDNLRVQQIRNTQFIQVSYEDPSPERAKEIVRAAGDVFVEQSSEVSAGAHDIKVTPWEQTEPESSVSANLTSRTIVFHTMLALVLGAILGIHLALLLEYLVNSLRSPSEAERVSEVSLSGRLRV